MTIISIDFSILYPGVCICNNFDDYKWIAIVNSNITKIHRKNLENLTLTYPNLKIYFTETKREKQSQYHLTERIKLINYLELTSLLISKIKEEIDEKEELLIVLEGMSFGSSGNALVDIAQATGILKKQLVINLLNGDHNRLFIFSPGELKNAIGCKGNAGKKEVFAKFKEDPVIKSTLKSDLHLAVNKEEWFLDNKENIVSPIMDMVDSYLGITKIHQILNQNND